jgi:rhamnosyltransferase
MSSLCELIDTVADEARAVFVFANSAIPPELEVLLRGSGRSIEIIGTGHNVGLGTAYNRLIDASERIGAANLLLFDQDSRPRRGIIARLEQAVSRLMAAGHCPAIVAPQPIDQDGHPLKLPWRSRFPITDDAGAVDFVISSGSLILLEVAPRVGRFREDFFIDAVDVEWCLRAWHKGCSIWAIPSLKMSHQLGLGVITLPFGLAMAEQPPSRYYTYLRNQFALLRLKHVPFVFKFAFLLSLPFRASVYLWWNRFSSSAFRSIGLGIAHGIRNRLGSPELTWKRISGTGR